MVAMLEQFAPEIWIASGPTVTAAAGFHYPTRMAVIRLAGGALFVWSPVALSDALGAAVDDLGEVRYLIAPNALHHTFLAEWRRAYPAAKLYGAPGLRRQRKDLSFDGELGDAPSGEWADEIDQVVFGGNLITTEVVFFHRGSRTVLFTDLIQQFSPGWFRGWRALVARLDLMTSSEPAVPRKFRNAFVNRRLARAARQRILAWPAERVLMAHAPPVSSDGQAFIGRAFRWLRP
ncbi:DUF4336 domain-containing protein [Phenylobacterium sp.]|uniref:DUF4336 domain-containing protein n=1 Tax=Phenylobacterium sp. TaxID=1871053 RepID=UPI002729230C|nr:DUF4336 domain-containing protein [Phenylobacterium sp.]MDO8801304.1 DUF4336 domain-containing protein [Phenylobacterium sp.]